MALPQPPSLVHAIVLSLMGILLLDTMGAIIKHLVITYPAQQLSAFRNFFGLFPRAFQGCEESMHLILCLHMMLWLDCVEGPDGVCAFT